MFAKESLILEYVMSGYSDFVMAPICFNFNGLLVFTLFGLPKFLWIDGGGIYN